MSGDTITTTTGTTRAYLADRRNQARSSRVTQIIKVVNARSVTIAAGATLNGAAWDGSTGGLIAVAGRTVNVQGTIDASCIGFRGGASNPRTGCSCQSHPSAGWSGESWNGIGRRDGVTGGFGCCSGPSNVAPAGYNGRGLNNAGGGGGGSGACHGGGGAGGGYGDWANSLRCPSR